jgi:hypothetical protein
LQKQKKCTFGKHSKSKTFIGFLWFSHFSFIYFTAALHYLFRHSEEENGESEEKE